MDWKDAIAELQRLGLTQQQIAEVCHCQQTTISALATGRTTDPKDSTGQAIRTLLAAKRCEAALKSAPATAPAHGAAAASAS